MGRTRASRTAGALGALGALVAALLVVVGSSGPASALPPGCTTTYTNAGGSWTTPGNWNNGLPNENSVACIPGFAAATLSGATVNVARLHVDGDLTVSGASLFVSSPLGSEIADGASVLVDHGTLGGTGVIFVHGRVEFTGGSTLASVPGGPGTAWGGQNGTMYVAGDGNGVIQGSALALRAGYAVIVFGELDVQNDGLVSADWGTRTTIVQEGRLELQGDGGYYQGSPVSGRTVGELVNEGAIAKVGGGKSIIDAAYSQSSTGRVEVDCCATLAFAGGQIFSGTVQPNQSLGTGVCGPNTVTVCTGSENPAVDPSSVVLELAGNAGNEAGVEVQELALPAATTDSRAIGNEVYAHAEGLSTNPLDAATITLRFSQADVMNTPLAEVQVGHISDTGLMTKTPDCLGPDLPSGAKYCVVRPVTRTAQNTFVTVKTIETSRWRLRRTGPTENFDQSAPGAPTGLAATKVAPFDGSQVGLTWQPPANDGGAAVTAYRIYRNGALLRTTGPAASTVVKDPGPGTHVFTVAAVNALGESVRASTQITLAKMSKPRKLATIRGKKGGKKTAGVKWKAPASAGGLTITGYQVKVLTAGGRKVKVKVVAASKLRYVLTLKPGRYVFKVRARNAGGNGPWSKATDPVRPR